MGENVQPWDASKVRELRGQARGLMKHGHSWQWQFEGEEEMTRENCGACVLAGYVETTEGGSLEPNYAGWARAYVEAGAAIPEKYREAFEATRHRTDNLLYVEGLERDIVTFGVRFED